jgi:hypothetical protein
MTALFVVMEHPGERECFHATDVHEAMRVASQLARVNRASSNLTYTQKQQTYTVSRFNFREMVAASRRILA